jgi:8-amino-7-oxononanoate synthase
MSAYAWITDQLAALSAEGLRRELTIRPGPQQATLATGAINFGSNDYLGLASDPRLTAAAHAAAKEEGWGSGASPLITGRSRYHAELEAALARLEGTEAALLFPSGFAANAGVIPALADRGDIILGDAKNHASIIDGCRLSRAERQVYRHLNLAHLEELLKSATSYRRRLIVTDSLFSMDGDVAPLGELASLAQRYDAMLLVDEAHATGVFGEHGGGLVENHHLEERIPVRIGTLSKALGTGGGFVCGPQNVIDWLANKARSYVFSTAQPAAVAAAGLAALEIVKREPERRTELLDRAAHLREALAADGWNIGCSTSQIIPLVIGDVSETMRLAAELREQGFLVPGIRPPTVPAGESLLRISLCYGHTPEMIARLVDVLRDLKM